jgi:hypothetical protein
MAEQTPGSPWRCGSLDRVERVLVLDQTGRPASRGSRPADRSEATWPISLPDFRHPRTRHSRRRSDVTASLDLASTTHGWRRTVRAITPAARSAPTTISSMLRNRIGMRIRATATTPATSSRPCPRSTLPKSGKAGPMFAATPRQSHDGLAHRIGDGGSATFDLSATPHRREQPRVWAPAEGTYRLEVPHSERSVSLLFVGQADTPGTFRSRV